MCSPIALAGAQFAAQVTGEYMTQKATYKNAVADMKAQREAAITNMNHLFQNYEMERQDAFDAAVMDLDKMTRNFSENLSQVEAAVNEGYSGGGRTADMVNRTAHADLGRARASIKDNYERKSNEIDLNKESVLNQTNDYIKGINMSAPKMPSRFANALTIGTMGLSAYTQGRNQLEWEQNNQYGGNATKRNPLKTNSAKSRDVGINLGNTVLERLSIIDGPPVAVFGPYK